MAVQTRLLQRGVTYTIRTDGLTGVAPDTVMHLFDALGNWVASNDECPGAALGDHGSCITYTPLRRQNHTIVVHAFGESSQSSGSLVVAAAGGATWRYDNLVFGGASFRDPVDAVGWTRNDVAVSVSDLDGPDRAVCLALVVTPGDRNDLDVIAWDREGRWMGGCRLDLGPASDTYGSREGWFVVGGLPGMATGPVTLYVNDPTTDSDADTLGDDLEARILTCSGVAGDANCSLPFTVPNGIDSDGDGLHDDWELFGLPPSLPLARWGADPLHKDAFIEVDNYAGAPNLTTADAETIATIYRGGPWEKLRNPDRLNGVALHFDLGVSGCTVPGVPCTTIHGDWGGHSVIPAGVLGHEVYPDPAYFADERRGVFTMAIASAPGGGGQCCVDKSVGFGAGAPGGATVDALAHEWGHLIGFQHGGGGFPQGDYNCKPNYESVMNYAFGGSRKFSDGTRPALNAADLVESDGVGPDPSYMTGIWDFASLGQALDWNRDGTADTSGVHQYGYPRWAPGPSCGSLESHKEIVNTANAFPDKSPSIVSYDGKIWVFYWHNDGDDLGYVRFTPLASLGGDLRRCGPPDDPTKFCTVMAGPSILPAALSSSPMFMHCRYCSAADGLDGDRLIGVYGAGRGGAARYRIMSMDRSLARAEAELSAPRPATFANTPPYTDPTEFTVADPSIVDLPAWIMILYRHTDGTLHQVLLDHGLSNAADDQITVGGAPVAASGLLGRDPALLWVDPTLYAYYVDAVDVVHQLRWIAGANWLEDADVFAEPVISVTQPGVVATGVGLPFAIRLEVSHDTGDPVDPFPRWREWTNPWGHFSWRDSTGDVHSNGSFMRDQWTADYRGATRLARFGDGEVAAAIGSYESPIFAAELQNDPSGVCAGCDCHLGTRPDASGGRTACGHVDGWGAADKTTCNCPNARQLEFRPLADGVVNATLLDFDDWSLPAGEMCRKLRPCTDCIPPSPTPVCAYSPPQSCRLPSTQEPTPSGLGGGSGR
ncbi:MAG: hypothetical protein HY905_02450 [Deltaproteobacteria bacterium]|nr:hypothetical protein [Deltaproteobacteria bacterium]